MNGDRTEQRLIAELCHQINSPLAAIRNAMYLSACRSNDPEVLRYLQLANEEISAIARILREARVILENIPAPAAPPAHHHQHRHRHSRRAAA